jgi:hypothetical protein
MQMNRFGRCLSFRVSADRVAQVLADRDREYRRSLTTKLSPPWLGPSVRVGGQVIDFHQSAR